MLRKWEEWTFYALIVCIPFTYVAIVPDPAHSIVYLWISIAMIVTLRVRSGGMKFFEANRTLFYIFTIILVNATISICAVSAHSESMLEYFRILFFFSAFLFFIRYSSMLPWLPLIICMLGVLYGIFGFVDFLFYQNPKETYQGLYDIRAHIGHKNLCSIFLNCTIPFVLISYSNQKSEENKILAILYFVLTFFLICLFKSRVGFIGACINIMAIGGLIIYKKSWSRKKIFTLTIGLILALSGFILATKSDSDSITNRMLRTFQIGVERNKDNQSVSERVVLWRATIDLIKDNPIMGCGLGQWKLLVPSKNISTTRAKFGNIIFQQPHNDFLWVFAESGLLGGCLYLLLFLYPIVTMLRRGKRDIEDFALILFLVVLATSSFVDFPKERPIFLFLFGYVLARFSIKYQTHCLLCSKWLIGLLSVVILFFFVRCIAEIQLTILNSQRGSGQNNEIIKTALKIKKLGVLYDQTSTPLDYYIGESYLRSKSIDSSLKFFKLAINQSPYHLHSWNILGIAYLQKNEDLKAVFAWEKAKEICINFAEPRCNLAQYYIRIGDYAAAENQLQFDLENDVITANKNVLRMILNQLIESNSLPNPTNGYKEQLKLILNQDERKFWLLKQFAKDSLSFKTQLENDIQFVLSNKKKN